MNRLAERPIAPREHAPDWGMATNQCPFCELVFPNLIELQSHISVDHPDRNVPERRY